MSSRKFPQRKGMSPEGRLEHTQSGDEPRAQWYGTGLAHSRIQFLAPHTNKTKRTQSGRTA